MALETELDYFNKTKAELLKNHPGKFALIKGEQLIGVFDTPANAFDEGVKQFGREPFMVKRISESEEVYRNQALALGLMNARL